MPVDEDVVVVSSFHRCLVVFLMTQLVDGGVDTKENISKYKGIYLVDKNSKEKHTYVTEGRGR